MTQLIIARHGNTFAPGEVPRRIGAHTDLPLVDKGFEQAQRLGAYLASQQLAPVAAYCSTLMRTSQTAETAIAAAGLAIPVQVRAIFDEIDYGPDENMPEERVRARIGKEALKRWETEDVLPEGWRADIRAIIQNWHDFGTQMQKSYPHDAVLIVTSGGIARFAPHITGDTTSFRRNYHPKLAPGQLGIISDDADQWVIRAWNISP